jgi:hypothetical protein
MFETIRQGLLLLAPKAVRTISSLLRNRTTPPGVKLRSAIAVLEMTSQPPTGPTDPEDARVMIAGKEYRRHLSALTSRASLDRGEHLAPRSGDGGGDLEDDLDEEEDDLDEEYVEDEEG